VLAAVFVRLMAQRATRVAVALAWVGWHFLVTHWVKSVPSAVTAPDLPRFTLAD
jgi:uncharacterized membrane protein